MITIPALSLRGASATTRAWIRIDVGDKRYGIEIDTRAYELMRAPAAVIEMPARGQDA